MIERFEALILTDKDKFIKGFVDRLNNVIVGTTTYIADDDGKVEVIHSQNGEEIKIDQIFVAEKGTGILSKN